jgi:hypothetical protein
MAERINLSHLVISRHERGACSVHPRILRISTDESLGSSLFLSFIHETLVFLEPSIIWMLPNSSI